LNNFELAELNTPVNGTTFTPVILLVVRQQLNLIRVMTRCVCCLPH